MQKGISFVGLMDLGTLDALKKPVATQINSTPPPVETSKGTSEKDVAKANNAFAPESSISTPIDLQPC